MKSGGELLARNKNPEVTLGRILDVSAQLFFEKGYDNTTIQDIINALGDLSKGAIYHHFKSKEEIIVAVSKRIYDESDEVFSFINSKDLTGLEKLKRLFTFSIESTSQDLLIKTKPDLLKNPKLLAIQLDSTINYVAPNWIEPILREGIADGSIKTDHPKELSEVMMLLSNVWLNPLMFECTSDEFNKKLSFFKQLMDSLGIDIFDSQMLSKIQEIKDKNQELREKVNF